MHSPDPVRKRKPADKAIVELIERNIRERVWLPGDRLPTERELAEKFGSSRNTLRRGLKILESAGKITRHVGRGSFVSGDETLPSVDLTLLAGDSYVERRLFIDFIRRASPVEIMEVRTMIEPAAAAMAAVRATREDLHDLASCLSRADQAIDLNEFEDIDAMLHMKIVLSTKNRLLCDIYHEINGARTEPAWKDLKKKRLTEQQKEKYHRDHSEIVRSILNRDAEQARDLSRGHLREVADDLFGI